MDMREASPLSRGGFVSACCGGVLFLLSGSACSYQEVVFKGVEDVSVQRMDGKGMALVVNASVENPNNYRIQVKDPDVDVFLNDLYLGKAVLDETVTLEKRSTRTYAVPLHASFDGNGSTALVALMGAALSGKGLLKVKGTVTGRVGLFRKKYPFEQERTIDLGR
jgi:hypothetical protein